MPNAPLCFPGSGCIVFMQGKPISNKPLIVHGQRLKATAGTAGFDSLDLRLGTTARLGNLGKIHISVAKACVQVRGKTSRKLRRVAGWTSLGLNLRFALSFIWGRRHNREQCHLSGAWTLLSFVQATRLSSVRERLSSSLRAGGAPLLPDCFPIHFPMTLFPLSFLFLARGSHHLIFAWSF